MEESRRQMTASVQIRLPSGHPHFFRILRVQWSLLSQAGESLGISHGSIRRQMASDAHTGTRNGRLQNSAWGHKQIFQSGRDFMPCLGTDNSVG